MRKVLAAATAALLTIIAGNAQSEGLSQTVNGVTIYLGVMPSEIVRGHPAEHPKSSMHRSPKGSDLRHIVVALLDAKTTHRITDAEVSARVEQLGLTADHKDLGPMQIGGTISYGNFFRMPGKGLYKIRIVVKRRGVDHPIEFSFEYRPKRGRVHQAGLSFR